MLDITPVDPLPPDVVPTTPPEEKPKPPPTMPSKPWADKPLLKSRTIVSIVLTILLFVAAKFFGVDIDLESIGVSAEGGLTIGELLLLVGALVAGFFRVKATGPIRGVLYPPETP